MKTIIDGKRYSTAKAELVLRLQHSEDRVEQLWLTKKGSWLQEIQANGISEKPKTALFLMTRDEVFEYLEAAQFAPPGAYSESMDPQGVVKIMEHYFAERIKDE